MKEIMKNNMSNNKQQTAVEWLIGQIKKDIIGLEYDYADELKQAKEMEKQQKANTWNNAINVVEKDKWDSFEEFYEKTYGGNK
jgi:hypothetical protein